MFEKMPILCVEKYYIEYGNIQCYNYAL